MCGIAGIINLDGRPVDTHVLEGMARELAHRGPDGQDTWLDKGVGFAHRRLAILDVEGGVQPIVNEREDVVLTYNGEIYNFVELREALRGKHQFNTTCDTEVLLRAYEEWGIECLNHLRGMFAFAIYDLRRQIVYIVRDRMGIKPVYYGVQDHFVSFASELSALLMDDRLPREIDEQGLLGYLNLQYVPTPASIYKSMGKLEPAHFLKIDLRTGALKKERYWSLDFDREDVPYEESRQELERQLFETTNIYTRSDVPFGAFLSGGVDSSLISGLMSEQLSNPVKTFTIGYEEKEHSEMPYAQQASDILKTEHFAKIVSWQQVQSVLPKLVRHFGEPFGDSSAAPTYFVSMCAAEHVKMVLSGDGGDEAFAGYHNYAALFSRYNSSLMPHQSSMYLAALAKKFRLNNTAGVLSVTPQILHDWHRMIFHPDAIARLNQTGVPFRRIVPEESDRFRDQVAAYQYQDMGTYMLDDILTKVDRMSMANSLEVRVPLLDHKIVEFAFGLPLDARIIEHGSGGQIETKRILKGVARRYFTPEFLNRPKMGFGIPVREWLLGPMKEFVRDHLSDWTSEMFDMVSLTFVSEIVDDFYAREGQNYSPAHIWILLMLKLWFDEVHAQRPLASGMSR